MTIQVIDLVNIRPDNDLCNEDEADDDNTLTPMVQDVPGTIEICAAQAESVEPDTATPGGRPKKKMHLDIDDVPVWR